jgi:hypothetical protein
MVMSVPLCRDHFRGPVSKATGDIFPALRTQVEHPAKAQAHSRILSYLTMIPCSARISSTPRRHGLHQ